jgi:hypothetical protein
MVTRVLTEEQRSDYQHRGVTRLLGAVDADAAQGMAERVWGLLAERLGIDRDTRGPRIVGASKANSLKKAGAFNAMASPRIRGALDELLGAERWVEPEPWGQLLFTLPMPGTWFLPSKSWHLDFPAPGDLAGLAGAQVFVFLEPSQHQGGGTLCVEGSHTLIGRRRETDGARKEGRSKHMRQALVSSVPWMRDLTENTGTPDERIERFMRHTTEFEGAALRVAEMTGEPGDAWIMHPWLLHASSPNTGGNARMMLTERLRMHGTNLYQGMWERALERQARKQAPSRGA